MGDAQPATLTAAARRTLCRRLEERLVEPHPSVSSVLCCLGSSASSWSQRNPGQQRSNMPSSLKETYRLCRRGLVTVRFQRSMPAPATGGAYWLHRLEEGQPLLRNERHHHDQAAIHRQLACRCQDFLCKSKLLHLHCARRLMVHWLRGCSMRKQSMDGRIRNRYFCQICTRTLLLLTMHQCHTTV